MAPKYSSMSPYNYCGGNPINMVDPDGRDPFTAMLGIMAIGGGLNLLAQAIQGRVTNFEQGLSAFGIGAAMAGLTYISAGGFSASTMAMWAKGWSLYKGDIIKNVVTSNLMQMLPPLGVNVPINDNLSIGLNPSFGIGSHGLNIGMSFGFSAKAGSFSFGGSFGGSDATSKFAGGPSGNIGRLGGFVGYTSGNVTTSFSVNNYFGSTNSDYNQSNWMLGVAGDGWSIATVNDAFIFGDLGRTAAFELTVGSFSTGFNIHTTSPGGTDKSGAGASTDPNWQSSTWGENSRGTFKTARVLASYGYFGYNGPNGVSYRGGIDHWRVQDIIQNGLHRYGFLGSKYGRSSYFNSDTHPGARGYSYIGTRASFLYPY